MSTRSLLVQFHDDTKIYDARYVHSDGADHGPTLLRHYADPEKVQALFALGDLSVLGEELGETHDFDWRMADHRAGRDWSAQQTDPRASYCKAYHRDRGEELTLSTGNDLLKLAEQYDAEYVYQWFGGTWVAYEVGDGGLVHFEIELPATA